MRVERMNTEVLFEKKDKKLVITINKSANYLDIKEKMARSTSGCLPSHSRARPIGRASTISSASTNHIHSPFAASNPAFLAAETPRFFWCITVKRLSREANSSQIAGQSSGDPSSIRIASQQWLGDAAKLSRQARR